MKLRPRMFARALVLLFGSSFFTLSSFVGAQKPPLQPAPPPQIPPQILSLFPSGFAPPGGFPLPSSFPRWPHASPPAPPPSGQTLAGPPVHRTIQTHLLRPETTLIESPNKNDQLRGVVRAATGHSSESTALLLELWTGRSRVLRDAEVMTAFTRGLAKRRSEPRVRDALASILGTWNPADATQPTHTRLVRYTAAIALAEEGSDDSVRSLFAALERESVQDAARAALLRFPPRNRVFLSTVQVTPHMLRFLEELGDLRYADDIFRATTAPGPEVRAAALHAGALTPDTRVAEIARKALLEASPSIRSEATFALTKLHAKDADVLVANLLQDETTALRGAQIATLVDTENIVKKLGESIAKYKDPEIRAAALDALAQSRKDSALDVLAAAITTPDMKTDATRALAFSAAPSADSRIERLARRGGPSDLCAAIQAYGIRLLLHGPPAASSAMNEIVLAAATQNARARSKALREELAPAWFTLAVIGKGPKDERELRTFIAEVPPVARRAYASALAFLPPRSPSFVHTWLTTERDDKTLRVVVAASLSHPETAFVLSRKDAFSRANSMGVEAPLAAAAWVHDATQENREEDLVTGFLHAPSANIRAAAALGLRSGKLRNAVGLLLDAYDPEADTDVRVAILSSLAALLAQRPRAPTEGAARDLLASVAAYDPDPIARYHAERARAGAAVRDVRPPAPPPNTFATLLSLSENTSAPLALYVAPGPVFRVIPFAFGEAVLGGISDRTGKLNLAVELP